MMKIKKTYIIAVAVLLLVMSGLLFSLLKESRTVAVAKDSSEKTWQVNASMLHADNYQQQVVLFGAVESPQVATLKAAIGADVTKRYVKEGQAVKAGELLIKLDGKDILLNMKQRTAEINGIKALLLSEDARHKTDQSAIEHNKALVELEKKSIKRFRYLSRKKLGPESAVDKAEKLLQQNLLSLKQRQLALSSHQHRRDELSARINRLSAILAKAKLNLERTEITAPFNGKVIKTFVSHGDRVMPGDKLMSLYNTDDVEVRAQLPEKIAQRISHLLLNGEKIMARAIWYETELILQLVRMSADIPSGHSSVNGFFSVLNESGAKLPLGTTLKLSLILPEKHPSFSIPYTALYGYDRIYLIKKDRLKSIDVKRIGNAYGSQDHLLISSPHLKDGDIILTSKLPLARNGLKVRVNGNKANARARQPTVASHPNKMTSGE